MLLPLACPAFVPSLRLAAAEPISALPCLCSCPDPDMAGLTLLRFTASKPSERGREALLGLPLLLSDPCCCCLVVLMRTGPLGPPKVMPPKAFCMWWNIRMQVSRSSAGHSSFTSWAIMRIGRLGMGGCTAPSMQSTAQPAAQQKPVSQSLSQWGPRQDQQLLAADQLCGVNGSHKQKQTPTPASDTLRTSSVSMPLTMQLSGLHNKPTLAHAGRCSTHSQDQLVKLQALPPALLQQQQHRQQVSAAAGSMPLQQ